MSALVQLPEAGLLRPAASPVSGLHALLPSHRHVGGGWVNGCRICTQMADDDDRYQPKHAIGAVVMGDAAEDFSLSALTSLDRTSTMKGEG